MAYVAPHDIECYKFHNYGNIAHDCRHMMYTSLKKNVYIRYKEVWKRKEEEHVNKYQVLEIVGFAVV
jgi:hypothetical protein